MTSLLDLARHRINSALDEVHHLQQGEFPYDESKAALLKLAELFESDIQRLGKCNPHGDPAVIQRVCSDSLDNLFRYLPILGFILRSTNVRNAFEVYGPLRRLIRQILGFYAKPGQLQAQLVLSSEWEYSPYTYPTDIIPDLPDFVFIGLPAQESSNPLLLPIAGHEIGHSLWSCLRLDSSYSPEVEREIPQAFTRRKSEFNQAFPLHAKSKEDPGTSVLVADSRDKAKVWTLDQAQESYCDFIALRIFGISYLYAFRYLLAPGAGARHTSYPNMEQRARHLAVAAAQYGINLTDYGQPYEADFQDQPLPSLSDADTFILSVADEVHEHIIQRLIQQANDDIAQVGINVPSPKNALSISQKFLRIIPADKCQSLADLLNGGWLAYMNDNRWATTPEIHKDRNAILFDLILKSVEVFEIEQIVATHQTA